MNYEFKNLKEQDIIEFLRDINFEIHDNKVLHHPDPLFVTDVLATCATRCLSKKKDNLASINFKGLNKINHESHSDAIQFFNHFYCIKELMEILNIQDFSLLDIINPQPRRIKFFLSVIVGYMRLKDREEANCKEDIMRNKELEERMLAKKAQYEKVKQEHDTLVERKNQEMPIIQHKKKEIELNQEEIKVRRDILTGLQNEEDNILKEHQALDTIISELRDTADLVKMEIEQLQKRIVKSPEKIIEGLNQINNEVKMEKEALSVIDEDIKKLNWKLEIYGFLQQGLEECFKMMEDIRVGLNNEKNTRKKLKDMQRDGALLKDQLEEKTKELQDLYKSIKSNEERVENLEGQLQKRLDQINGMVAQHIKEKNNLQKEHEDIQVSVRNLDKMKGDMEHKTKEIMQMNESFMKEMAEVYDDLLNNLQGLHGDLSYLFETCKQNPRAS